ncbi:glycosyltransferase family 2 protein [Lignipirellula cremea]|uniref:Undecaprenyl-phosphate 4-deoxy-4-formamido-L-arabinose transferase n=1 Tax=Lignipirellula cremea TaxID=2528010 RepID=A0A518DXZ1_9BACT|nr:glycosyltransferase family 2 protein [Lignipirellula cremea]QDU96716.1 Undecaprenyl-phosphate 4-deoxy-4-formamido-L-arabinose transferase [Lignipirellula cremea]
MSNFSQPRDSGASEANLIREAFCQLSDQLLTAKSETTEDRAALLEQLLGPNVCRRLGIYSIPADFLLSVVIPVYNEEKTIARVIERVRQIDLPCEMVIVDDCSQDGTRAALEAFRDAPDIRLVFHEKNQGKGAALKSGFAAVSGDVVVIQDADMEYDPRDLRQLLQPILENEADVVYGSRFSGSDHAVSPLWHRSGNQLITAMANLATGLKFTDVETCYKMFRRELIDQMTPTLREKRFGIEIEMTCKLARRKDVRFHERPISYNRRSYAEGKKIGWRDAVRAFWCMLRY